MHVIHASNQLLNERIGVFFFSLFISSGCCPLCQKRINITTFEPNTDLRNYIDQYEAIEKSVLEDTATEQPTTSPLHEAPPPESVKRTNNDSSNYMSKRL